HMIADPQSSLRYLEEEYAGVHQDAGCALADDIGNGRARLHLRALQAAGLTLPTVNRFFVHSANRAHGSMQAFARKLDTALAMCAAAELPFAPPQMAAYVAEYRARGCPAVHHSVAFGQAYRPAYRVVDSAYVRYHALFAAVDDVLRQKGRAVVAIDGMCGAGKSTLARLLGSVYDTAVIHMDDFFLPPALRTAQRLQEPGGNVHYERFTDEVIRGLKSGQPFDYRIFDCAVMDYRGSEHIAARPVIVVEGSYSLRPAFRDAYDLSVFLSVGEEEQTRRIQERNGPDAYAAFRDRWIPMENRYFDACDVARHSTLRFDAQ
ncbi:MAG: hypothetical protein PHO66_03305, partial [Eubacteriales bacterium]|nr:hypothetical protein [Eubacteriales bacterium]